MNLYLQIKSILESDRKFRNNYRLLFLEIWSREEPIFGTAEVREAFMRVSLPENLRRTAQKVVENHPNLDADVSVRENRTVKEKTGGNFVFHNSKKTHSVEFIQNAMSCLEMKWRSVPKEQRVGEEYEHDRSVYKKYQEMITPTPDDELTQLAIKLFGT
jgi:hypothetical protein